MKLIKVRTTKNYRIEYWRGTLILSNGRRDFDILRYTKHDSLTRLACSDARFNSAEKFFSIKEDDEAEEFMLNCFMCPFIPIGDCRYFCEHYYPLKINFGDGFNAENILSFTQEVI